MNHEMAIRRIAVLALVSVALAGGVLAFNRHATPPAPLVKGQLQIGKGWSIGGMTIRKSQVADFSVALYNRTGSPITLESASVIVSPGSLKPKIMHLGVFTGSGIVGATEGWPPSGAHSAIVAFRGYSADNGLTTILVALSGIRVNLVYGMVGLEVQYNISGKKYSSRIVGSGGEFCIESAINSTTLATCGNKQQSAVKQAMKLVKS